MFALLSTACSEHSTPTLTDAETDTGSVAMSPTAPPLQNQNESLGSTPEREDETESESVGKGQQGNRCTAPAECASGVCISSDTDDSGVCVDVCTHDEMSCNPGSTCTYSVSFGYICTPDSTPGGGVTPDITEPEEPSDSPVETQCSDLPENRRFIYTVDHSMKVRTIHPSTYEVQERGQCELTEVYDALTDYLIENNREDMLDDMETVWDLGTLNTLYINSLAMLSSGQGFISFTAALSNSTVYGVIEVSNLNATIDCKTSVLGIKQNEDIAFSVSVARELDGAGEEKLYGNVITAQSAIDLDRDLDDWNHEDLIPRVVFEIDTTDPTQLTPVMSAQDLGLAELTQNNQGQLISLYSERGCHGDCRPREVGEPAPAGVKVTQLKFVDVNLNSETLGQPMDLILDEPFNIFSEHMEIHYGNSFGSGRSLVFFNNNPYVIYTIIGSSPFGRSYDNLFLYSYKRSSQAGGASGFAQLTFDPETQAYTQVNEPLRLNFTVVGSATISCDQ